MSLLEINLLRAVVPTPIRRRRLHLALMAYLAFSGILLVWVANLCARRLVEADYHRQDARRLLRAHAERFAGDASPDATLARLKKQGDAVVAELGIVEKIIEQRVLPARLLLGLRQPIPDGALLIDLLYQRSDRMVQFGVAARQAGGVEQRPGDLLERWNADPLLTSQLYDVKPVRMERIRREGREVLVERYTAGVGKGGDRHGSGPVSP